MAHIEDKLLDPHLLLPRTTPEAQGIASAAILQFVDALDRHVHELHSFMLLRHGVVITEGWWSPYRAKDRHTLYSVSKSFTSTAVGFAVSEGRFSINDPVVSFFPTYDVARQGEFLAAMTVEHLLTMTTGQTQDSWQTMVERADNDWINTFFDVPVVHAPGTQFLYNNGATYLLSAIVQQTTGMNLIEYLQPRLFEPLGIDGATWESSPQGISVGAYGLSLCTEDIARFGQLYLQGGRWGDRQLLPQAWIDAAAAAQVENGNRTEASDSSQGYGYQFWRCRHNAYRASGVFGQYCVMMPDQDAVVVFTAGLDIFDAQQPLDLIWEIILPAMCASPLPMDAAAQAALSARVSSLARPVSAGQSVSPASTEVVGRTYRFDANPLLIEAITLRNAPSGWTVQVATATGEDSFPCGYGSWEHGTVSTLFKNAWWSATLRTQVATSGAWTNDDCFSMLVRLVETPYFYALTFNWVEDALLLEVHINVTLESPAPLLLLGRRDL
ncbi:MAG: serine hydrolase [Chloroflexota bacterium]|nr:serine hydrolase [Chloroflexota bacterium]